MVSKNRPTRKITLPNFYRNFALIFISASLVLLFVILYFINAKVIITVIPVAEKVATEFTIEVIEESTTTIPLDKEKAVSGIIKEISSFGSQNFPATDKKIIKTNTVGDVTIINNYSSPQTLVASTRLLSPTGILLRLEKTVVVPPAGKVNIRVYPDKPEEFDYLEPTKFTIPGLWQPLQEKIYAESYYPFKKGEQTVLMVSEKDLKEAEEQLKKSLSQQAVNEFNQLLSSKQVLWSKLTTFEIIEKKFSHQVGEETPEFKAEIRLNNIFVAFDESQVVFLAKEQLKSIIPPEKKLMSLNTESLSYLIKDYNSEVKKVQIKIGVEGWAEGDIFNLEINKEELSGKTLSEIRDYFAKLSDIKEVRIDFSPHWLKRSPSSENRIFIKSSKQ